MNVLYVILSILVVLTVILGVGFKLQSEGAHLFKTEKAMNNKKKPLSNSKESQGIQGEKSKYNMYSIIGFVLSIISIFGIGLLGYIGIVMGIVALTQIKYTKEKGHGLAWAAVIVGAIWGPILGIINLLGRMGY